MPALSTFLKVFSASHITFGNLKEKCVSTLFLMIYKKKKKRPCLKKWAAKACFLKLGNNHHIQRFLQKNLSGMKIKKDLLRSNTTSLQLLLN